MLAFKAPFKIVVHEILITVFNFLPASGDFCLITFANSLNSDQAQQNVGNVVLIWIQTVSHSEGIPE